MGVPRGQLGGLVLQEEVAVLIGHPLGGADDGLGQLVAQHRPVAVHGHDAGEGQTVHLGIEGADAVGEGLRQHGHHLVGKIYRGAPVKGLQVQGGALGHVVGHIGDVDPQDPVAVAVPLQGHGVVKILGGSAVDGDDGPAPQVQAALQSRRLHRGGRQLGGGPHGGGKVPLDAVLVEDGLHAGTAGAVPAEGGLEGAHGGQLGAAEAAHGHGDLVAGADGGGASHHLDGVGQAVAAGLDPDLAATALHRADDGAVAPLQHGGDNGGLPVRVLGVRADHGGYLVAVPGPAVAAGRHKQVRFPALRALRGEKAEALGGGLVDSL